MNITQYIPCAFINSEDKPLKASEPYGLHVSRTEKGLSLHGFVDYQYPHPDAPDYAVITVTRSECLQYDVREHDNRALFGALTMLLHSARAADGLRTKKKKPLDA